MLALYTRLPLRLLEEGLARLLRTVPSVVANHWRSLGGCHGRRHMPRARLIQINFGHGLVHGGRMELAAVLHEAFRLMLRRVAIFHVLSHHFIDLLR